MEIYVHVKFDAVLHREFGVVSFEHREVIAGHGVCEAHFMWF